MAGGTAFAGVRLVAAENEPQGALIGHHLLTSFGKLIRPN